MFNSYWVGMFKYACGLLGHGTPKFVLSQERINGLKRFFTCSHISRQTKSYYNSYWMGVVKYGYDLVGYKALKSTYQR